MDADVNWSPGVDDAPPERANDADVRVAIGPDTDWRVLMRHVAGLTKRTEGNYYDTYLLALRTLEILGWAKVKTSTAEFLGAAEEAGIKRTYAYQIIQFRVFEKTADINALVEKQAEQHKARGETTAFQYPDLKGMLKMYRPPSKKKAKDVGASEEDVAVTSEEPDRILELNDQVVRYEAAIEALEIDKNKLRAERMTLEQKNTELLADREAIIRERDEALERADHLQEELQRLVAATAKPLKPLKPIKPRAAPKKQKASAANGAASAPP